MRSGSLTDLDPPPVPERRWPFYVAWAMGVLVVGAVLVSRLPTSLVPAAAPAGAPVTTSAPIQLQAPAPLRLVNSLPQPVPLRGPPVQVAPARP